jgi:hypothetical protein
LFLGVYVNNEEHLSSSVVLLTIKEHLYKLQSSFLYLRNSLNASELNHEKTKEYFQKINSHIDLFSKIEQNERYIADWEYSSSLLHKGVATDQEGIEEAVTVGDSVDNEASKLVGNVSDSFFYKNIVGSCSNQESFKVSLLLL